MVIYLPSGIINGMKLKIDRAGRIVVPKPLRDRLGLKEGAELDVVDRPEGILLRMVDRQSPMVQVNGLWVHRGRPEPNARWDGLIDEVRGERIEALLKA